MTFKRIQSYLKTHRQVNRINAQIRSSHLHTPLTFVLAHQLDQR